MLPSSMHPQPSPCVGVNEVNFLFFKPHKTSIHILNHLWLLRSCVENLIHKSHVQAVNTRMQTNTFVAAWKLSLNHSCHTMWTELYLSFFYGWLKKYLDFPHPFWFSFVFTALRVILLLYTYQDIWPKYLLNCSHIAQP